MTRSINKIEYIFLLIRRSIFHLNCMKLDGDTPFLFKVHIIKHLLHHVSLFDRSGLFKQSVCQCRFAVINVGDDAEISYVGFAQILCIKKSGL